MIKLPGAPGTSNKGTLNEVSGLPSKGAKGADTIRETLKLSGNKGWSPPTGPRPWPRGDPLPLPIEEGSGICPLATACMS